MDAATEPLAAAGITIDEIYWTVGPHDLARDLHAPDDETLAAALLALAAAGYGPHDDDARVQQRRARGDRRAHRELIRRP